MKTGTCRALSFFIALLLLCAITTANPDIIAAHTMYRNEVGVAPLTYSSTLAASAQAWADHDASIGSLVHSSGSYGENIASGMPTGSLSWTDVVNLWGEEKSYFIYGPLGNDCSSTGHWYDVGHYTQIVWSTTTQCGCGKATNVTQNTDYFVCQYSPPGNYWGEYPYPQVVLLPIASFTVNTTSGTAPLAVLFTDQSTGSGITAWNWSFGDGTWENRTSSTNPIHTYGPGTWYPTLTVTNSSGSTTSLITPARTLTVVPALMVLTVSANPPAVIAGTPTNVNFTVRNQSGFVVVGALVTLTGVATGSNTTGADGNATISVNAGSPGTITATASLNPYASGTTTIYVISATPPRSTKIGIFRQSSGIWSLDSNGNYAWEGSDTSLSWGLPNDVPVIGDWNGDNRDDIGIFRPSSGIWSLDSNGNFAWEPSDTSLSWGLPNDLPIIGDWNGDTKDDVGIFRPSSGIWSLDSNGNFVWESSDASLSWGLPNDKPVIGDWNGDNKDDIGIFRPGSAIWSLDSNGNVAWEGSDTSLSWGLPNDVPVLGDWNGNGTSKIGIFRPSSAIWSLDSNGNYIWEGSDKSLTWGLPSDKPAVGKW
jgi:PKD repeat protein